MSEFKVGDKVRLVSKKGCKSLTDLKVVKKGSVGTIIGFADINRFCVEFGEVRCLFYISGKSKIYNKKPNIELAGSVSNTTTTTINMAEIDLHDEVIRLKPVIKPVLRDAMGVAYPIKVNLPNGKVSELLQPARFVDNGNDTITDTETGLMWKKHAEPEKMNWHEAMALKSDFAGFDDWRLPTIKELLSLVNYEKYNPAINAKIFPNTATDWFWSSSPYLDFRGSAWIVDFIFGDSKDGSKNSSNFVRLVRHGH